MKFIAKAFSTLILIIAFTQISYSQTDKHNEDRKYIKVEVNGMACPFCAYGLEKKLKKLDDAEDLQVFLQEGYVVLNVPASKVPTEQKLRKIVADAGFEAGKISFSDKPFTHDEQMK